MIRDSNDMADVESMRLALLAVEDDFEVMIKDGLRNTVREQVFAH